MCDFNLAEDISFTNETIWCSWIKCIPAVTENVFEYEYALYNWYYGYVIETRWTTDDPKSNANSQFVWKPTGEVRFAGQRVVQPARVVPVNAIDYAVSNLDEFDF